MLREVSFRRAPFPFELAELAIVGTEVVFFDGGEGEVRLTFNTSAAHPLNVSGADPVKWWARFDSVLYGGTTVEQVDDQTLRVYFLSVDSDGGADVVSYSNAPSDIQDTLGRQLAACVVTL